MFWNPYLVWAAFFLALKMPRLCHDIYRLSISWRPGHQLQNGSLAEAWGSTAAHSASHQSPWCPNLLEFLLITLSAIHRQLPQTMQLIYRRLMVGGHGTSTKDWKWHLALNKRDCFYRHTARTVGFFYPPYGEKPKQKDKITHVRPSAQQWIWQKPTRRSVVAF